MIDAYSLTLAVLLLTAGVVGDIRGRREVFAIGLGIFTVSSLVCGLSTTPLMLNIARAVQGTGGAVMFATSVALIASAFQGRERGTAFGIYGAVLGGAVAVGPLVGGALTTGVGWRWIFFVNVPIGIVAVGLTLAKVQESRDPTGHRIDWIGVATFSVSLFTLILALIRGNADGWASPTIVTLLVISAVAMGLFILAELRVRLPDARPVPVPSAGHDRECRSRPSPWPGRSSPCSSTSPSTSRTAWVTARLLPACGFFRSR